mgnify:CR=1 FL=1
MQNSGIRLVIFIIFFTVLIVSTLCIAFYEVDRFLDYISVSFLILLAVSSFVINIRYIYLLLTDYIKSSSGR